MQVPYLVDPNLNFESGDYKIILSHLFRAYSSIDGESVPA